MSDASDAKTRELAEALADAICTLEEMKEDSDCLEDLLEAAQAVADAEEDFNRHLSTLPPSNG